MFVFVCAIPSTSAWETWQLEKEAHAASVMAGLATAPVIKDDGPAERTASSARDDVDEPLQSEGSGRAGESTCSARNRVRFHDQVDIEFLRWITLSERLCEEAVSGCCDEMRRPDSCSVQEIDSKFPGYRKSTKVSGDSTARGLHKHCRELDIIGFNRLDGAFEGDLIPRRRGAGKGGCYEEGRHLEADYGFRNVFHVFRVHIVVFCFRVLMRPVEALRSTFVKGNAPSIIQAPSEEESYHSL